MAPHPRYNTVTTLQNAQDQSQSRLFALAPELRNRIYELVLEDGTVSVESRKKNNPKGKSKVPGVLLACKQAYAESLQIFFSLTTFVFTNNGKLAEWLQNIGPQNRSLVSRIDFVIPSWATTPWWFAHIRPSPLRYAIELKIRNIYRELERRRVMDLRQDVVKVRVQVEGILGPAWWISTTLDGTEMLCRGNDCWTVWRD